MGNLVDDYLEQIAADGSRLRVWSMIVTIFGDAIEPRGGVLRLNALQQIINRMGIGDNAFRTAMSRLASDGWLKRKRIGRASYYSPTAMAKRENAKASETIYRYSESPTSIKIEGSVCFAISKLPGGFSNDSKSLLHNANFGFIGNKTAVSPRTGDKVIKYDFPDVVIFNAREQIEDGIADILKSAKFHKNFHDNYRGFAGQAKDLKSNLKKCKSLSPLDAMVLRSLLVHNWRRIVLRDVQWPRFARNKNWSGFKAQALMKSLYHELLEPSEIWLDQIDATPEGKLPKASANLRKRFKP